MHMEKNAPKMLTAKDVMERLSVSKSTAYLVMREINSELESQGLRIQPGRVSQRHFDAIYFGDKGVRLNEREPGEERHLDGPVPL